MVRGKLPAYNIISSDFECRHSYDARSITQHDSAAYLITVCQLCVLRDADTTFEDCFTPVACQSIKYVCK
jgi:hypothetical protein